MTFAKIESWIIDRPPVAHMPSFIHLPAWSQDIRKRATSLTIALCVHAALLLIIASHLADLPLKPRSTERSTFTLFDVGKPTGAIKSVQTAKSPDPAKTPPHGPQPVAQQTPLVPVEWQAVKISTPADSSSGASKPAITSETQSSVGSRENGGSSGSHYDPYAGATYRPAGSGIEAKIATSVRLTSLYLPPEVDRTELIRLLLNLESRLHHVAFSLQITADRNGNALQVRAVAPGTPATFIQARPIIETGLIHQRLLRPDPTKAPRELVVGPLEIGTM